MLPVALALLLFSIRRQLILRRGGRFQAVKSRRPSHGRPFLAVRFRQRSPSRMHLRVLHGRHCLAAVFRRRSLLRIHLHALSLGLSLGMRCKQPWASATRMEPVEAATTACRSLDSLRDRLAAHLRPGAVVSATEAKGSLSSSLFHSWPTQEIRRVQASQVYSEALVKCHDMEGSGIAFIKLFRIDSI